MALSMSDLISGENFIVFFSCSVPQITQLHNIFHFGIYKLRFTTSKCQKHTQTLLSTNLIHTNIFFLHSSILSPISNLQHLICVD